MNQSTKNYCSQLLTRGLLVLMIIGTSTACAPRKSPNAPDLRIGVAVYQQDDTFITTVVQNMERMIREEEVKRDMKIHLSIVDGRSNQTVQLDQIDYFIEQGCDVLCVNIVDRTAAAVLIDKAKEAKVPLIFFNRQPVEEDMNRWEDVYYVGADGTQSGELQAQIVKDVWFEDPSAIDMNGDGKVQYVMLEGEPSHQDTMLRTQHAINGLTSAGIKVEKQASGTANWNRGQASTKMAQWINESETPIEVVFANNDDMALGAIDSYITAEVDPSQYPIIIGVDAIPSALQAIEDGTLTGTVLNDSSGIASAMMTLILELSQGQDPAKVIEVTDDHYVWLEYQKVTAKNIEELFPKTK